MIGKSVRVRWGMVVATVLLTLAVAGGVALAAVHLRSAGGPAASPPARPSHPARAASLGGQAGIVSAPPRAPSTPATRQPAKPLAGRVVGIDPGHNGGNGADPAYINQIIWNGRESETCDTTGTQTDGGYTEARYTFNVALYLLADLRREGARVVMTRTTNDGVGPCVNRRAGILNRAGSDVAIDIHADGGPSWGRGFTVLEPVADGPNGKVISASQRLGDDVRLEMRRDTSMPVSDYYGHDGIQPRNDLAGLNLTTVPKVLLECGNMRNAVDAQLLTSAAFQAQVAKALAAAITLFLAQR
jgi:N-acetylmuramoyl-L-alanine amidase